ncbi:MAG: hypothetical protein JKY34_10185 [Kordiimonadaceae bacterium]|nr:hypothetical protein [Kordiimonadaceae bacterium]
MFGETSSSRMFIREADKVRLLSAGLLALWRYLIRLLQIFILPVLLFSGVVMSFLTTAAVFRFFDWSRVAEMVSLGAVVVSLLILPSCVLSLAAVAAGSRKHQIKDAFDLGSFYTLHIVFSYGVSLLLVFMGVIAFVSIGLLVMALVAVFLGIAESFSIVSSGQHELVVQGLACRYDLPFTKEKVTIWLEGVDFSFLHPSVSLTVVSCVQYAVLKLMVLLGLMVFCSVNANAYLQLKCKPNYRLKDRVFTLAPRLLVDADCEDAAKIKAAKQVAYRAKKNKNTLPKLSRGRDPCST